MSKTLLIIKREYLTRVKKKSFIIMTILGPVLIAAMVILPALLSKWSETSEKDIAVLDETGLFFEKFKDQDQIKFYHVYEGLDNEKEKALYKKGDMLLYIPLTQLSLPVNAQLFSTKQPGLNVTSYIKTVMEQVIENEKLKAQGIDPEVIKSAKADINLSTIRVEENGDEKRSYTEIEVGLAIFAGIMIYFFIFMFGAQVLKGVMEEKQNRIVEVIISSVKPFQLMMGKIIGIALVGLTQFLLWIFLTGFLLIVFQVFLGIDSSGMNMLGQQGQSVASAQSIDPGQLNMVFDILGSVNFTTMVLSFIFYFLGGYLLYASLFAAIGGAVDHDADSQQFMLPVSIPLVFAVMMSGVIVNQPDSNLSIWLSMIPFTSPITMMMRIPFGVPYGQIIASGAFLILGFIFTTWLAGKIYRTGILMYGQKVNYSIIWKWLRQKH